ncbi:tyrosine-type recombinase/integrase [Enterococcus faecalis]|nr:tyrosine-type recombinase/integrase [Enterococcus faecalis]
MSIKKMNSGNYKVEVFYPKEVREILGVTVQRFRKTYPSKKEAEQAEKTILRKIEKVLIEKNERTFELKATISFKDFYEQIWLDMYINGSSGRNRTIPADQTILNTKDLFRLHILPMFGNYSLLELNTNKDLVLHKLNVKAQKYANIKTIKSYVNQLFDIAELLDYIEYNRIAKIIRYVGDPLKQRRKRERVLKGEALTAEQLLDWIQAIQQDFNDQLLTFQDYVLFTLTLNLGDRKSESYALQWKHIDLKKGTILLVQSKDKQGNLTPTKGRKNTKFHLPTSLIELLAKWKNEQAQELLKIGINQHAEQFLFTFTDRKGNINVPVHMDYLNYRINSVERRHNHLVHATPHKLRHTFSTLAYEGGATMEQISRALTHSDTKTTEIYVNTPNIVDLSTYEKFEQRLKEAKKAN